MSNSHVHLNIHCSYTEAKWIEKALTFLGGSIEEWQVVPTLGALADDPDCKDFPKWCQTFTHKLVSAHFEVEEHSLAFEWTQNHNTRMKSEPSEATFLSLSLHSDNASTNIFVAVHLILNALDSQEIITAGTTGIPHTGDRNNPLSHSGNTVVIGKHSWDYIIYDDDVVALATEIANNHAYWLITYATEGTGHPTTLILGTSAQTTKDEAATKATDPTNYIGLPEQMEPNDLHIAAIDGKAFRQVTGLIPTYWL
jgi:hypothetical protein